MVSEALTGTSLELSRTPKMVAQQLCQRKLGLDRNEPLLGVRRLVARFGPVRRRTNSGGALRARNKAATSRRTPMRGSLQV